MELGPSAFDALIARLHDEKELVSADGLVRENDWKPQLTNAEENAARHLVALLEHSKWTPPKPEDIDINCKKPDALVAYLIAENKIIRIGGMLYSRKNIELLVEEVRAVLEKEGSMSPSRFKEITSLSRKTAIPLLEYLDAEKITKRQGDTRVSATSYSQ